MHDPVLVCGLDGVIIWPAMATTSLRGSPGRDGAAAAWRARRSARVSPSTSSRTSALGTAPWFRWRFATTP